jgi:predicted dienelactone hydrolase
VLRITKIVLIIGTALGFAVPMPGAVSVISPPPTGPAAVGTTIIRLVGSARPDPLLGAGTAKDEKRELLVRFWYPMASGTCAPAEYTSAKVWAYLSQATGILLPPVKTHSCLNAAVAPGLHPVIVFSHGYTGMLTDGTFIFEELASRGYVTASIAHAHESTAVEFPDGRLVISEFGSYLLPRTLHVDVNAIERARSQRTADIKFLLDEFWALNTTLRGPFHYRLDLARIGIMGHSLGGETALRALQQDSRIRAAIWIDGVISKDALSDTSKPVLLLAAGRDKWKDDECRLWSHLHGTRLALTLHGAAHLSPTDAIWLGQAIPQFAVPPGAAGFLRTIAEIRRYIAGFFDTALFDRPEGLFVRTLDNRDSTLISTTQSICPSWAEGEPQ